MTQETVVLRGASLDDLELIRRIYNEAVDERVATLETERRSVSDMADWWAQHDSRYAVVVAVERGEVVGWASLNRFSQRCAHGEIADLSIYVSRERRGSGIGFALLTNVSGIAAANRFHKIVLHALNENEHGKRLYRKAGFSEVGVFKDHGRLHGRYVDVVAMERLL